MNTPQSQEVSAVAADGGQLSPLTTASAPPIQYANPFDALPKQVTLEDMHRAASAAQTHIRSAGCAASFAPEALIEHLAPLRQSVVDITRFVHNINALPPPGAQRNLEIGQALLPLAIWHLWQRNRQGHENLLFDIYCRTHLDYSDPDNPQAQISFPDWLIGLQNLVAIHAVTADLPGPEVYLARSEEFAGQFTTLKERIAEKQKQLERFEEMNEKSGKDTWSEAIDGARAQRQALQDEVNALAGRVKDVPPESVEESMAALGLRTSLNPQLLGALLELAKNTENLLLAALAPASKPESRQVTFKIPQFTDAGTAEHQSCNFGAEQAAALASHPALLSEVIYTWLDARAALRSLLPTLGLFPRLKELKPEIYSVLERPFSHDQVRGPKAVQTLLDSENAQIRTATLALLADKITGSAEEKEEWGHSLEDRSNIRPLLWTVRHYLKSQLDDAENPFLQVMQNSPELQKDLLPFLRRLKTYLAERDYQAASQLVSDEISASLKAPGLAKTISPLAALAVVIEDPQAQSRIKKQIPNITELKDLLTKITTINERLKSDALHLIDTVVRGLSVSMADFYRDPEMGRLWKFLEKYKRFLKHPNCLEGLDGDEAMASGIFVAGDFGVGKTFFVKCLVNELNLKCFTITPDQGEISKTREKCRNTLKEAKDYSNKIAPCVLFIDESESIMPDRYHERTTAEQEELTCYMLQEINEIRVKFPKILLVAATNYPERIDGGMLRPGRFDIKIVMGMPGPVMREGLLLAALHNEKIALNLTDAQLKELVELTDGMLPLMIKRTIYELNRFGKAEDPAFQISFEMLRQEYQEESHQKDFDLQEALELIRDARKKKRKDPPDPRPAAN